MYNCKSRYVEEIYKCCLRLDVKKKNKTKQKKKKEEERINKSKLH